MNTCFVLKMTFVYNRVLTGFCQYIEETCLLTSPNCQRILFVFPTMSNATNRGMICVLWFCWVGINIHGLGHFHAVLC